jgi:hypothetical protein
MEWDERFERERSRYEDGMRRLTPGQLLRLGNAAYGAGLSSLMLGHDEGARDWLERAADRWRESWEHAGPDAWGRPVGAIKALVIAHRHGAASDAGRWAVGLGSTTASSAIGRYAGVLALLVCERDPEAERLATTLRELDFPVATADALTAIAGRRAGEYEAAVDAVLASFETRADFLDDIPVADTVLVLQALARTRGIEAVLRNSALLPGLR